MIIRILGDVTDAKNKMRELDASVSALEKSIETKSIASQSSFTKIGSSLQGVGSAMQQVGAGLTTYVSIPLALLVGQAAKFTADFELAFTNVRKVMDATAEEIQQYGSEENFFVALKNQIRELSMELPLTHQELSAIMETAGRLGIRGQEALGAFTEASAKLSITTGIASEELSMLLGRLVNIMGIDVETEIMKVADTITHLGNNTATTEKALLNFATRMGGAGKLIGLTTPQVLGIAAAADSVGIKAERGGTAMTKIFMAIQSEISKASVTTDEFNQHVRDTAVAVAEAQKKVNDAQVALNTYEASGAKNNDTLAKLRGELKSAQDEMSQLLEIQGDLTTSVAVATNKYDGFAGFLGMTKAEFKTLGESQNGGIVIFQRFVDELQRFKDAGGDVASKMKELGLGDSRLMAAVLNLSEANNDGAISASDLARALGLAEAAWQGFGDAAGATDVEVNKFLDTTHNQLGILRNTILNIADVIMGPANASFKEFLKGLNEFLDGVYRTVSAMSPEELNALVKTFVGLIALGPGLTIAGGFVKSFGTAFSLLGIAVDGATQAIDAFSGTEVVEDVGKKTSSIGASIQNMFKPKEAGGALVNPIATTTAASGVAGSAGGLLDVEEVPLKNGGIRFRQKSTGKFISSKKMIEMAGTDGPLNAVEGDASMTLPARKKPLLSRMGSAIASTASDTKKNVVAHGGMYSMMAKSKMAEIGTSAKLAGGSLQSTGIGKFFAEIAYQLSPITNFITAILPKAIPLFMGLASKLMVIATVLAAISGGLALFFVMTGQGVEEVNAVFSGVGAGITAFIDNIIAWIDKAGEGFAGFSEKFKPVFDAVVVNLTTLLTTIITKLGELLPKLLAFGVDIIVSIIRGFVDSLPLLFDSVIQMGMTLLNTLWEMLPSLLDAGFKLIGAIIEGIGKAIPHIFKAVWDLFWALVGFLIKIVLDGSLIRVGYQIVEGIIIGIGKMLGALFTAAQGIGTTVLNSVKDAGSWLFNTGKQIIQGLLDGLNNMANNVGKFFSNSANKWVKDFAKFFGIKSPSRVFMGFGNMIGDGLAIGLEQSVRGVEDARDELESAAFFQPDAINKAMDVKSDGTLRFDYSGLAEAFAMALESVGLNVYMDGKDVTDIVSKKLVEQQRRGRVA